MSAFEEFLEKEMEDKTFRASFEDVSTRQSSIDALIRQRKMLGLSQAEVAKYMQAAWDAETSECFDAFADPWSWERR